MKLIEYIPSFLKDVREFNEIFKVEDIELDGLRAEIEKLLKEVIVKSATRYGLERYEKIYRIVDIAETIEARRINILFRMRYKIPYTYWWLIGMLNEMIGKENYVIELDCKNYSLTIEILDYYKSLAKELEKDLRKKIPANLVLNVNVFQPEKVDNRYISGIVHVGDFIEMKQEV